MKHTPWPVYIKLLATAFFWGGTFVAGRVLAGEVGPYAAAFLRFAVAGLLLGGMMVKGAARPTGLGRRHIGPLLLLGMSGVFAYNVFFFKGLKLIEAGRSAIIIACNPILIALSSTLLFQERLTAVKGAGILLSVSGAVLAISRGNPAMMLQGGLGWGELYIFGSVISWVVFSLVGKTVLSDLSPLTSVTVAALVGAAALFFPAWLEGLPTSWNAYSLQAWVAILYLGCCGTVLGFIWYYEGIRAIGPTKAGIFINFVPLSAILLAFLLLGEALSGSLLVGALLVGAGVFLTNTDFTRPRRADGCLGATDDG